MRKLLTSPVQHDRISYAAASKMSVSYKFHFWVHLYNQYSSKLQGAVGTVLCAISQRCRRIGYVTPKMWPSKFLTGKERNQEAVLNLLNKSIPKWTSSSCLARTNHKPHSHCKSLENLR